MAAYPVHTFLPVPQLRGESNLAKWKLGVLQQAEYNDLTAFFESNVSEPTGDDAEKKLLWRRQRVHAMALMTSTISQVKAQLTAAGWRHDGSVKDPKVLWDLVCTTIPKASEQSVPQLFNELIRAKLDYGTTLQNFNARFYTVASRLAQLDVALPPKAKMFLM
ncbi:hypothetical protein SLS62_002612 [Diatrype stigma]|uniref:Gag protein n=1 Tax=Diatrype stigma TaxID=117547 RepID=A0AAN9UU84_9PEZI